MIIIYFLILLLILIRLLRFLAIVQQKEYRLDRLLSYFHSASGKQDLVKIWPNTKNLTATGLKRPIRTFRVFLVGLLTLLVIFSLYLWLTLFVDLTLIKLIFWVLVLVCLPLFVTLVILPTSLISYFWTLVLLKQASQKISDQKPLVIGITGSFGKSSTKQLLAHLLQAKFKVFATPKSFNTKYSVAQTINNSYAGQEVVILEYGAYSQGEIKTLAKYFKPTLAMITGFAPQHLDLFGSEKNIIQAKRELILAMDENSYVFANARSIGVREICQVNNYQIIDYSGPDSQVMITAASLDPQGKLSFSWKDKVIKTQLVGKHYLEIVAGSIAVAQHLGLTHQQIMDRLSSFKPTSNFISSSPTSTGALIINDGLTTNPAGFKAALDLVKDIKRDKKVILVTGGIVDLGHQEKEIHLKLAQAGAQFVDQVWYFGLVGKPQFNQVFAGKVIDSEEAIKEKITQLSQDDLVLLEGKQPLWLLKSLKI